MSLQKLNNLAQKSFVEKRKFLRSVENVLSNWEPADSLFLQYHRSFKPMRFKGST